MSCFSPQRRVEFDHLRSADRIEVFGPLHAGTDRVATITDGEKIRHAVTFIERYEDGWIDVWSGPAAPYLSLEFYQSRRSLGHFGIARAHIVAGSLSQKVPPAHIAALAQQLGLEWPFKSQ